MCATLRKDSELNDNSRYQEEALASIFASSGSGVIHLPCGAGKTSVFVQAALGLGQRVLFVSFEGLGARQIASTLKRHTTLRDDQVHLITGSGERHSTNVCFASTTYHCLAQSHNTAFKHEYDLVVLDEAHHAAAKTFREALEKLFVCTKRVLSFTATLVRSDRADLNWLGPVLYRATYRELCNARLVAKIYYMSIRCEIDSDFGRAHAQVEGTAATYLAALNPVKLDAMERIVRMERNDGHLGVVFSKHLVVAQTAKDVLGARWKILSGSDAMAATMDQHTCHTTRANVALVGALRSGELDGLIITTIGEGALDLPEISFAVGLEGNSGLSSDLQRIGRLSRTPRLRKVALESADDFAERCLNTQRSCRYYDLTTVGTEEDVGLRLRRSILSDVVWERRSMTSPQFNREMARYVRVRPSLRQQARTFAERMKRLEVLVRCLRYRDYTNHLQQAAIEKRRVEASLRSGTSAARRTVNALLRKRRKKRERATRKAIATAAFDAAAKTLESMPVSRETERVLASVISLDAATLNALGVVLHPTDPPPS